MIWYRGKEYAFCWAHRKANGDEMSLAVNKEDGELLITIDCREGVSTFTLYKGNLQFGLNEAHDKVKRVL